MIDARNLKPIGSTYCKQYQSEARFFIEDPHPSGHRHLVVQYEKGGYGGAPELAAGIPEHWTNEDVEDLLLRAMKSPDAPYPAWEVHARAFGSPWLFRYWAGEKPPE